MPPSRAVIHLTKIISLIPFYGVLRRIWHSLCIYTFEEQIFIKLKEMKKLIITSVLAVLAAIMTTVSAQNYPKEYLGLPGDNLNLYAVMDLFRNSETLEEFERSLNDRDTRINNLDLNGDWRVDYIAVSDYRDGRVHTIVLRAVLGRKEFQDVAVITVEKLRRNKIRIQIIGDQALYGKNYVIEPLFAKNKKVKHYNNNSYYGNVTIINNVWWDMYDWPVVVYIYSPYYSGWSCSWYWGYYPDYWDPWRPYYWDYYYGYHSGWHNHYYNHYHCIGVPRYHRYNDFYYHSIRLESPQVQRRVAEGNYRQTYSRPEQRSEGEALYNRTHRATVEGTRSEAPANTPSRREAAPQSVSGRSTSASTDAERRVATDARPENRPATEARDAERRSSEAVEAQAMAAEERVARERVSEQRAAESRAESGLVSRELPKQGYLSRELPRAGLLRAELVSRGLPKPGLLSRGLPRAGLTSRELLKQGLRAEGCREQGQRAESCRKQG